MGGFACLCKSAKNRLEPAEKPGAAGCNCGWEIETGYAVACGLAILEAKRLFLLALGTFVDWNVIYFAGGLVPVVLTIVSASIGVPAALATVFFINRRRQQPCHRSLKKHLRYLSGLIIFCCALNVIATASITVFLNTSPRAITRAFNTSMMFYSDETWHKVTIDQIQFTLQCCGHTAYSDWIAFDWQKADYASRDEMSNQKRLSDELYRPMAVPYSCCSTHAMAPCFHMDLSMTTVSSINEFGCAKVLSRIVLRSVIVTYCVFMFLVLTQIVLSILLVKIVRRPLPSVCPSICDCTEKCPSAICPLLDSSTSCCSTGTGGCTSGSETHSTSRRSKKRSESRGRLSTISSRSCARRCTSSSPSPPPSSSNSKKSSLRNNESSARTRRSGGCGTGAAKIRPSLHTEHRVPKKRCYSQKRAGVRPN